MEQGPHGGFLLAIGIWTAIQLTAIAFGAYFMLRERRRAQSR